MRLRQLMARWRVASSLQRGIQMANIRDHDAIEA